MGLDMYLMAEKSVRGWDATEKDYKQLVELFGLPATWTCGPFPVGRITLNVIYWRKANSVHNWFVQVVQGGVDECQRSQVTREQLTELLKLAKAALRTPGKAREILPTEDGFFFGSTDYGEDYMDDMQFTVEQLEEVLAEPAFNDCEFYYRASW